MHPGWNAAAVIDDRDAVVDMDRDLDRLTEARHVFIDTVVDDFVDEVMQAIDTGAADVHRRPLPHGIEPFQHLDLVCAVAVGFGLGGRRPWPSVSYIPNTHHLHQMFTQVVRSKRSAMAYVSTVIQYPSQILIGITTHLKPGVSASWIKQGLSALSICNEIVSPSMTPSTSSM